MLKVGITGGIGSGKTYVCHIFESLGIPVYYADDQAKCLMQEDPLLISQIKEHFGDGVYKDGLLDRPVLSSKVFSDKEALALLNSLVHPAVFRDTMRWAEEHKDAPYTIKEAALLYETGSYQQLDKIIVVTAPLDERIARVIKRDGSSREQILARIANQLDEQEKVKRADYVIQNGAEDNLEPQVIELHAKLLELAIAG